jgi:ATP-dependent Clp protease ATP-binding subunit ClpC
MPAATSTGPSPADLPFANDAVRLLAQARGEADRLGHEYLGTEHLVLAMIRPPASPSAAVLEGRGVPADQVYRTLAGVLSPGVSALGPDADRPFTSRTKQAFALAADSARELGHARIRSVHILVGIMREGGNIGAQVLAHHGLTADAAQEGARLIVANGDAP